MAVNRDGAIEVPAQGHTQRFMVAQVSVIATFRFRKSATATARLCETPGSRSKPNTQSSRLLIVSRAGSAATQKWPQALSFGTKQYCPRSVNLASAGQDRAMQGDSGRASRPAVCLLL